MIVSLWRNLRRLSAGRKSTSFFTFFLTYCKDIVNMLFWVLYACLAMYTQSDTHRKILCLSAAKKSTRSPMLLWRYCKDMQTYSGYFRHAWLHSPKMIVLTCRRPRCLSTWKNKLIIHFFLKILRFKESWNLIGWHHFGP